MTFVTTWPAITLDIKHKRFNKDLKVSRNLYISNTLKNIHIHSFSGLYIFIDMNNMLNLWHRKTTLPKHHPTALEPHRSITVCFLGCYETPKSTPNSLQIHPNPLKFTPKTTEIYTKSYCLPSHLKIKKVLPFPNLYSLKLCVLVSVWSVINTNAIH